MPDKSRIDIQGADEVARAFDKFSGAMDDMSDINAEIGQALIGDVRNNTRVKSGDLRASWETSGDPLEAQFSNSQSYAVVQEFGSKQVDPTLAVQRAFEANESAVTQAYESGIRKRADSANIDTT